MKTIINAIRDFLYNITDYGLIITVIVIMAVILSWRFDILFNRGIEKDVIVDFPVASENNPETPTGENTPDPENPESPEEPAQDDNPGSETNGGNKLFATVSIPEGSYPSTIGDILLNSNLIDDKNEFLNRSVELGLDTRLRSGTFEIEVGTSLDNVIKIIANAQ